jgi:hypothetical protein
LPPRVLRHRSRSGTVDWADAVGGIVAVDRID